MTYSKNTWVDGPSGGTPLSAARLNHMEDGIAAVAEQVPPFVVSTDPNAILAPGQVLFVVAATTDAQAPSVPGSVTALANSATQVTVSWAASTDNTAVSSYRVRRGGTDLTGATALTGTSFADTTVAASTAYSYTVSAVDAAGNRSAESTAATVTTPAAGAAFTPASLSPAMWYDSQDLSLGLLTSWADKSSNTRTLSLLAGSGATVSDSQINGRRAALFDGASAYVTPTLADTWSGADITVVAVGALSTAATTQNFVGGQDDTNRLEMGKNATQQYFLNRAQTQVAQTTGTADANPHLHLGVFSAAGTVTMEVDGVQVLTGSISSTSALSSLVVGARRRSTVASYLSGPLGTLLVFKRLLTAQEKTDLVTYLKALWGMTW